MTIERDEFGKYMISGDTKFGKLMLIAIKTGTNQAQVTYVIEQFLKLSAKDQYKLNMEEAELASWVLKKGDDYDKLFREMCKKGMVSPLNLTNLCLFAALLGAIYLIG